MPNIHPCGEGFRQRQRVLQLQHFTVQRQVRHDPFRPPVLIFKLIQPLNLRRRQARVLLAPDVKHRLRNARMAANLADRGTLVRLPQDHSPSYSRRA